MEEVIKEGRISAATLFIRFIIDLLATVILIGPFLFIRDLVYFFTTKLTITEKRVTGHTGLVHTSDLDSPLNKITGVRVGQGLFGKIFNYGTIRITTASTALEFRYISNPNKFRAALNNQIEIYKEQKMDYQAKQIGEAMKG